MDSQLLAALRCPWCVTRPKRDTADPGELELAGPVHAPTGLRCKQCGRLYAISDGIPNLLVEEAQRT
jgi:uncharacterized protein YbaR (Trm112 family)